MKIIFRATTLLLATSSSALAQATTPPFPELASPPGWPIIGYGLMFLLVGGAVYVSIYVGKRSNID